MRLVKTIIIKKNDLGDQLDLLYSEICFKGKIMIDHSTEFITDKEIPGKE